MVCKSASRLTCTLLAAALVAACQVSVGAPEPRGRTAPRGVAATPTAVAPPASAEPAAPATPGASPLARLLPPSGPSARLTGDVRLDASYLVAAGAGNILSHNGGLLVAAGGLNLIGADGASLVAAGAGNLISHNGGLVLSHNGGQLGAAGNVLSHNGSQLRLTQAPPEAPAAGALLPAAGVEIRVYALTSGAAVPAGVDAAGKPVYGVLTDAAGRYDLHVPESLSGNLLVQARIPGQDDPRLAYDLVTPSGDASGAVLDEDSALATRYLRHAFARKLRAVLDAEATQDDALLETLLAGSEATAALGAIAGQALAAFRARVRAAGVPAARHAEVAARVTDVLISRQDLAAITLDVTNTAWRGDADEPALAAMRAILRSVREAAAARLAREGAAGFDGLDYVIEANRLRAAGSPPLRVLKGADVGEIVVDAFLAGQDLGKLQLVSNAFASLGLDYQQANRLYAAASGIGLQLVTSFLADDAARAAVDAAITAQGAP